MAYFPLAGFFFYELLKMNEVVCFIKRTNTFWTPEHVEIFRKRGD